MFVTKWVRIYVEGYNDFYLTWNKPDVGTDSSVIWTPQSFPTRRAIHKNLFLSVFGWPRTRQSPRELHQSFYSNVSCRFGSLNSEHEPKVKVWEFDTWFPLLALSASPTSERQEKASLGCLQGTLLWSFPSGVWGDPHLDIISKIITDFL